MPAGESVLPVVVLNVVDDLTDSEVDTVEDDAVDFTDVDVYVLLLSQSMLNDEVPSEGKIQFVIIGGY